MASIIKNKVIYDTSQGDPLEPLKKSALELDKIIEDLQKNITTFIQDLRSIKKTDSGKEVLQVAEATEKLKNETIKFNKVKTARVKVDEQIKKAQQTLVQLNTEEAQELAKLRLEISKKRQEQKRDIKENQAAEGSIDKLRQELAKAKKEYKALSKVQRENAETGGVLLDNIQALDREYKDLSASQGEFQANVGNYPSILGPAARGIELLQGGIKQLIRQSLAFIATPLGATLAAITAAVGLFSASLNRSAAAQEAAGRASGALKGVWNALLDEISELVTKGLNVANSAITTLIESLVLLGVLDEDSKLKKTIDDTRELSAAENELLFAQKDLEEQQLKSQIATERLRQVRDDDSKSIEERIDANQQLGATLDEQIKRETALANEVLRIARLRASVEGETVDNLLAIRDAQIKLVEIQERVESQRSEQLTNTNALLREQKAVQDELIINNLKESESINEKTNALELEAEAKDEAALQDIDRQFELEEQLAEIDLEFKDSELARAKEQAKKLNKIEKTFLQKRKDAIKESATFAGEVFGKLIADGQLTFENFGKLVIGTALDVTEKLIQLAIAEITAKQVASKGFLGIATSAALIGLVRGVFSGIKSQVLKFADGIDYVQGPGTETSDSIPAMLSKGERVVDAKTNKQLTGVSNKDLPGIVSAGMMVTASNGNLINAMSQNNIISKQMLSALHKGKSVYTRNGVTYIHHWDGSNNESFKE